MNTIEVGDTVCTAKIILFADAVNEETGDEIEVSIRKWEHFEVAAIDHENDLITIKLPNGYITTLDADCFR